MSSFVPDYPWHIINRRYSNIYVRLDTANYGVILLDTYRAIKWGFNGENVETTLEGESIQIDYIPEHIKLLQGKLRI